MHVLDLFSGIGGMSLGLERAGMHTVAFCEIEPFCQTVLRKHWPHIPIYKDIRTLTASRLKGDKIETIDVICGGFPCQDMSTAGKGAGLAGRRSGLWKEYARLIEEICPQYAIIENVPLLRNRGLITVLKDLWEIGYNAEWHCIPASAVGAPHRRDRIWIVAYPCGNGVHGILQEPIQRQPAFSWLENVRGIEDLRERSAIYTPTLCRASDGVPNWVDRLKALGNAVVPQIVENIGRDIMAVER
jgi:DNA (cytosine-5)-methyltransferase 1